MYFYIIDNSKLHTKSELLNSQIQNEARGTEAQETLRRKANQIKTLELLLTLKMVNIFPAHLHTLLQMISIQELLHQ